MPKVSIGIPVWNGERHLAETLDSLLGQTFRDFEIVLSDNASDDRTEEIGRAYAAADPRIRYSRNGRNLGAAGNYSRSLALATGQYFRWNGYDDLCAPTYLEKCVAVLDSDPGAVLCHSRTRIIDSDGVPFRWDRVRGMLIDTEGVVSIERPDPIFAQSPDVVARFIESLVSVVTCHHALGLMRTDVLRRTGGLARPYANADRALLAELSLHGRLAEVPEPLFFKREHKRNTRLMSRSEKARWVGSRAGALPGFIKLQEYLQIGLGIWHAPISPAERRACLRFAVSKVARRLCLGGSASGTGTHERSAGDRTAARNLERFQSR